MALAAVCLVAFFVLACLSPSVATRLPFVSFTSPMAFLAPADPAAHSPDGVEQDPARAAQERIISLLQSASTELDRANGMLSEFELPVETAMVSTELRAITWFIRELTGKLERGALDPRRQKDEL